MAVDPSKNLVPGRVIARLLASGVNAISANVALLDTIIGEQLEDDDERTKMRTAWSSYPPVVVQNYPRANTTIPCYAVTLMADRTVSDRIGKGEHAWFDDADVEQGTQWSQRVQGTFGVHVFTTHPDLCSWWYRVARRIILSGFQYLQDNSLDDPQIDGQDLLPNTQYTSEHMFVRRLTLTVEYEETWTDQDALWTALNGATTEVGSSVDIRHEAAGGAVKPYTE